MRFTRGARARDAAADDIRERRLEEVRRTVEDFLYNVGLIVAGHEPDFTRCTSRTVDQRLRVALAPFLSGGGTLRPDFGSHAELRVEGDLLCLGTPVDAHLEFEDRSLRQSFGHRGVGMPRRRITMALRVSLQPCQIVEYTVRVSDGS